jgi:hypothetical protein
MSHTILASAIAFITGFNIAILASYLLSVRFIRRANERSWAAAKRFYTMQKGI